MVGFLVCVFAFFVYFLYCGSHSEKEECTAHRISRERRGNKSHACHGRSGYVATDWVVYQSLGATHTVVKGLPGLMYMVSADFL